MASAELTERFVEARGRALLLVQQSHTLHEAAHSLMHDCRRCLEHLRGPTTRKGQLVPSRRPQAVPPVWTSDARAVEHVEPDDSHSARRLSFELEGVIGDQPVRANFEKDTLICDPLLRTHAELVVALGDSFVDGRSGRSRPASLDGAPVVVLATLIRAMRVTRVQVAM